MTVMFGNILGHQVSAVPGNTYPPVNMSAFTRDATSNKAVPVSTTEWTNFLASFGSTLVAPNHIYSMQDVSGNILDTAGTQTYASAANLVYGKTVTGWTRKAISGTASTDVIPTNANGVNTGLLSFLSLAYIRYDAGTVLRSPASYGTSSVRIPNTTIQLRLGGNTATSSGDHSGTVHPILWAYNVSNSTCKLYTDLEKLSVTFTVSTGHVSSIMPSATVDPGLTDFLYQATWDGAAGETTDAEAKKLITALGYSPPWS
jgi:hypothetical protein